MRLFVAVDVDQATREAADRLRAKLRRDRPAIDRVLRWVEPQNLHLTIKFIGEHGDVAGVEQTLEPPLAASAFVLSWSAPAWLPPRGRPRVLYVAVAEGAEVLTQLAHDVEERLAAIGIGRESRAFTAHLTLARVREGADASLLRHVEAAIPRDLFSRGASVDVDAVVLFESKLSPRGPTYVERRRFALRRDP